MPDDVDVKQQLRAFICRELVHNPSYPLRDDEPLVTGGLIDSFSIAQLGVFMEQALGVYVPDTELTVENMDSVDRIVATLRSAGKGA